MKQRARIGSILVALAILLAPECPACGVDACGEGPINPAKIARTAGERDDAAVLRFEILDEAGKPMPGRLTFLGEGGPGAKLFPASRRCNHL